MQPRPPSLLLHTLMQSVSFSSIHFTRALPDRRTNEVATNSTASALIPPLPSRCSCARGRGVNRDEKLGSKGIGLCDALADALNPIHSCNVMIFHTMTSWRGAILLVYGTISHNIRFPLVPTDFSTLSSAFVISRTFAATRCRGHREMMVCERLIYPGNMFCVVSTTPP